MSAKDAAEKLWAKMQGLAESRARTREGSVESSEKDEAAGLAAAKRAGALCEAAWRRGYGRRRRLRLVH